MRNAIVLSLALVSSFTLTACGNGHKAKTKAKVALAKVTGDKAAQGKNVADIEKGIQKKNSELKALRFFGIEDGVSFQSALSLTKSYDANARAKIKAILSDVKSDAEQMIEAGKDLKGAEGDKAKSRGQQLKIRAEKGIEKMNVQERAEAAQKAAEEGVQDESQTEATFPAVQD